MRGANNRADRRRRWIGSLLVGLGLTVLAIGAGCSGGRYIGDNTGRAFAEVFKAQRRGKPSSSLMSGEDAEQAVDNMTRKTKHSEMQQGQGRGLLPLQR